MADSLIMATAKELNYPASPIIHILIPCKDCLDMKNDLRISRSFGFLFLVHPCSFSKISDHHLICSRHNVMLPVTGRVSKVP